MTARDGKQEKMTDSEMSIDIETWEKLYKQFHDHFAGPDSALG